jgi:hypothetical protein
MSSLTAYTFYPNYVIKLCGIGQYDIHQDLYEVHKNKSL